MQRAVGLHQQPNKNTQPDQPLNWGVKVSPLWLLPDSLFSSPCLLLCSFFLMKLNERVVLKLLLLISRLVLSDTGNTKGPTAWCCRSVNTASWSVHLCESKDQYIDITVYWYHDMTCDMCIVVLFFVVLKSSTTVNWTHWDWECIHIIDDWVPKNLIVYWLKYSVRKIVIFDFFASPFKGISKYQYNYCNVTYKY